MFGFIIKTVFFSIVIILIVHYLVDFFTNALTVPKYIDGTQHTSTMSMHSAQMQTQTQTQTQTQSFSLPEPTADWEMYVKSAEQKSNALDFFSKL